MLRVVGQQADREGRIDLLEEVLEKMDDCARLLRSLHQPRIDAYCLADFEGRGGGWLGEFVRDILEQELHRARTGEEDDEE
jgi:hypothetical protein